MFQECRHIKASGTKCEAPALKGEHFCYFHSRSRAHAKRYVEHYQAIDIPLLEDRSAIQHAITEVARAVATGNIDTKRAGLLLYSLQIASQNARNQNEIIGEKQVREVVKTEEGNDLGPETAAKENPAEIPCGWLFQAISEANGEEERRLVALREEIEQAKAKP